MFLFDMPAHAWFLEPLCLLAGGTATLWIREKARDAAKTEFTEQITAALAVFKTDLEKSLSDKFIARRECELLEKSGLHDLEQIKVRVDGHHQRLLQLERAAMHLHATLAEST